MYSVKQIVISPMAMVVIFWLCLIPPFETKTSKVLLNCLKTKTIGLDTNLSALHDSLDAVL